MHFEEKKIFSENNNTKVPERLEIPTQPPNIVIMASKKPNILFFNRLTTLIYVRGYICTASNSSMSITKQLR